MKARLPLPDVVVGKDLKEIFRQGYGRVLFPRKVAASSGEALRRLREFYGALPDGDGHNISGITYLRRLLWIKTAARHHLAAFSIVAPHTHWDKVRPIVISSDGNRYSSSARDLDPHKTYFPVSFVFSDEGPLPYEWADDSVSVDSAALKTCFAIIKKVNRAIHSQNLPLGISLNFRFKELMEERILPTIEYSDPGRPDSAAAAILPMHAFLTEYGGGDHVQVGWHAYHDAAYQLTAKETNAVRLIRESLKSLPETQKMALVWFLKSRELKASLDVADFGKSTN